MLFRSLFSLESERSEDLKTEFFGVMTRTESVEQAALGGVITRGSVNASTGHPGRLDHPKSKGLENAILMASRGVPDLWER